MPFYIKILSFILSIVFLLIFLILIRKRSINPFYSFLWIIISILMLSVVIFEKFYKWIATLLNISDASFLVFVSIIFFILIYILHLTIKISDLADKVQELISFTSILEKKIRDKENDE